MFGTKRLKSILAMLFVLVVMTNHVMAEEDYYKVMGVKKDAT